MGFKDARLKAGMTMEQAAQAFNVSRNMIWFWETGKFKPRSDKLLQIAKMYGCSVEDLLREDSA